MTENDIAESYRANEEQAVTKDKTHAGREEQPEPSLEQQSPLDGCIDYREMQGVQSEIGELMRRIMDFCISVIQRNGLGRN